MEHQRKLLCPILRLARSKKTYQGKCKIEDDHLVIQGKKYTVRDLDKLPDEISGFHASSNTNRSTFTFFGELSPFSNFHKAKFTLNNTEYFCSEQFIQQQKALLFDDQHTADHIMSSSSARKCKELGKQIVGVNENEWKSQAEKLCLPGILAKFKDNAYLADMLLSTGDQHLAEASFDQTWGTGIPIHHQDCLNRSKWMNTGLLGNILMYVRRKLRQTSSEVIPMDHDTTRGNETVTSV